MSCKSGPLPMITKFSEILTDKFPMVQEKCPPKKKKKKAPQTSFRQAQQS